MASYTVLITGWVVYLTLHSVLAMPSLKARFPARPYRVGYTILSLGGLLFLLFWNGQIPAEPFFLSRGPVRYLSLMFTTFGVMIIQVSFRQYSLRSFLGLTDDKQEFTTLGILQHVRHPIYSGTILVVLGFFFFLPTLPTLISCVLIYLYLPIGIYLEEKKLEAHFGDTYREYKKRVPALVPRLI